MKIPYPWWLVVGAGLGTLPLYLTGTMSGTDAFGAVWWQFTGISVYWVSRKLSPKFY